MPKEETSSTPAELLAELNISATPFKPAEKPTYSGLKTDEACEWELCRVREFWCDGDIADYEDLEELEAAHVRQESTPPEEDKDSEYDDDNNSVAEDFEHHEFEWAGHDFEAARALEMQMLRKLDGNKSDSNRSRLLPGIVASPAC